MSRSDKLTADGALLKVADEYRLQTREGSEWDQEFRNRQTKLRNDAASIQFKHDQLLYAELDKAVRSIKLLQGDAREARTLAVHREQTPPPSDGQSIPVWIRDGWSCKDKEHVDAHGPPADNPPSLCCTTSVRGRPATTSRPQPPRRRSTPGVVRQP